MTTIEMIDTEEFNQWYSDQGDRCGWWWQQRG